MAKQTYINPSQFGLGQQGVTGMNSTQTWGQYSNTTTEYDRTNPSTWSLNEQVKFLIWNAQVNHPESIEQFQALQDIERKVQEEERQSQYERYMQGYQDPRALYAQNAYQPGQAVTITTLPKQESVWDDMKRMVGIK